MFLIESLIDWGADIFSDLPREGINDSADRSGQGSLCTVPTYSMDGIDAKGFRA
jgi:hypothetical protein